MRQTPEHKLISDGGARGRRRWLSLSILIAGCLGFALTMALNSGASALTAASPVAPDSDAETAAPAATVQAASGDFSKFTHSNPTHANLACLLCHRREDNSPRPTLPGRQGHLPCAGCHTQEFASRSGPICTICHTSAEGEAVKPFPRLKSFNVKFSHAVHTAGRTSASCATCHKPSRRGVALTIPAGFNAHATCFQCHTPKAQGPAGRDISSCGVCHALGRYARTTEAASAYRVNFSHAEHGPSARLNCRDCHSVRAGAQGRQVTSPLPLNHHAPPRAQSCMTCHNGQRAFGGDDFSSCKRCHEGNHFYF